MTTIRTNDMAHGGDAVGRDDGKAYFINGALPDETVTVTDVVDKGSFAKAKVLELVEASPDRVKPTCPHFGVCGGCQWQYASYPGQLRMKREILAGQLRHLGKINSPDVRETVAVGPPLGYRNKMEFSVVDGQPALYQKRSHDLEPIEACQLLSLDLADLYARLGPLDGVRKIILRSGSRTGEILVMIEGELPTQADDWGVSVAKRYRGRLERVIGADHVYEVVADTRFRITGSAFFQANTPGADSLVALVQEALQPTTDDVLLDAYSGGGLFSATVGANSGRVIAVESGLEALDDLQHNLESNDCFNAEIVDGNVEDEVAEPEEAWTIAVCDPPRTGLGRDVVAGLVATEPRAIAYVSCDPASFSQDVRHFVEDGYQLEWATPVDMFPQTFHIEIVGLLVPA